MYIRQIPPYPNISVGSLTGREQETVGPSVELEMSNIFLMTVTTVLNDTTGCLPAMLNQKLDLHAV